MFCVYKSLNISKLIFALYVYNVYRINKIFKLDYKTNRRMFGQMAVNK